MDYSPLSDNAECPLQSGVDEIVAKSAVHQVVCFLAAERARLGLSKKRVAQLAGLDPKTVTLVESGERSPTLYTVLRICAALECDLWRILKNGVPSPNNQAGKPHSKKANAKFA